ncbi:hypothetical protein DIURU_003957 [Diutina rugosa]|uniref:t-SNARE coiled-coil homology domain-containing protein n=1 Tax=Diutina rugosa TaxID=5481 RepID=A0A642UJG9_DIURU|nr:uncharacterized protein DIURU_003957 [Diutina rugosa]KAA8900141.1 hypothetical protein DIURU_003957 [Diutina rugosa]
MSFANLDLEAQQPVGKQPVIEEESAPVSGENAELDQIINKTSKQLQVFSELVSQFETNRKQVGTRRDSEQLRSSTDALVSQVTGLESAISKLLANLNMVITSNNGQFEVSNRQMVRKERLVNEFHDLHRQFSNGVRVYTDKKKTIPIKAPVETTPLLDENKTSAGASDNQEQLQVHEQQNTINDTDLQYHILLTEERNQEIEQVAQGIQEINSIFKDLGQLVHQQGDQLDTIEDNVQQLNDNAQQADRALVKANEYQRRRSKWSCIFLVVLSIIVLIIVLAVVS